jgi:2-C-methyl-D-erythritol 4-phosphate cytidylyltransferase
VRATPGLGLVVVPPASEVARLRLGGRTLVEHALATLAAIPGLDTHVVGGDRIGTDAVPAGELWRPRVGDLLVLHDPRCPLLPAAAVEECVQRVAQAGPRAGAVGIRPVTDTLKEVVDGRLMATFDRDSVAALASPVVVGRDLLDPLARRLPTARDLTDLPTVVRTLCELGTVLPVEVPSSARRVSDAEELDLLECLHELRRVLRER